MARLSGSVVLTPIPRGRFDELVGLAHDGIGAYLGSADLPLAGGEHLAPGSSYTSEDGKHKVDVDSWSRDGATAARLTSTDGDTQTVMSVRLDNATAPRSASLAGEVRSTRHRVLGQFRLGTHADLTRWWTGTARETGEPAIEGWGRHALVGVRFTVTPAPAPGGQWQVTVRVRLRARGLLFPLTALTLLVGRWAFRKPFADALDRFAADWNRQVPELLALPPEALQARVIAELRR